MTAAVIISSLNPDIKPMSLELKRHHRQRLLRKRKRYLTLGDHTMTASVVNTPKPCSCLYLGCGHRREMEGPTIAEQRAELNQREQV